MPVNRYILAPRKTTHLWGPIRRRTVLVSSMAICLVFGFVAGACFDASIDGPYVVYRNTCIIER